MMLIYDAANSRHTVGLPFLIPTDNSVHSGTVAAMSLSSQESEQCSGVQVRLSETTCGIPAS